MALGERMHSRWAVDQPEAVERPEWLRELMMKKRAAHKTLPPVALLAEKNRVGPGDTPAFPGVHPAASGRVDSSRHKAVVQVADGASSAQAVVQSGRRLRAENFAMGEDSSSADIEGRENAPCGENSTAMLASPPPSPSGDDCEELEYGPGIVDKLKSRFISMSLREREPARRGLRRFSSLENLLDQDELSPRKPSGNRARAAFETHIVKRAVSMETLLVESDRQRGTLWSSAPKFYRCPSMPDRLHQSVLINEDVVIVENSSPRDGCLRSPKRRDFGRGASALGRDELPRTDIVRTYKRLFEPVDRKPVDIGGVKRRPPVVRASSRTNGNVGSATKTRPLAARVEPCVDGISSSSVTGETAVLSNGFGGDTVVRDRGTTPVPEEGSSDTCTEDDIQRGGIVVDSRDGLVDRLSPEPVPRLTPWRRSEDRPVANIRPITKEMGESLSTVRDTERPSEPVNDANTAGESSRTSELPDTDGMDDAEVLKPSTLLGNQKPSWQKPPAASNTVIFDFRGKDVRPNVAVNPAPFGCRAAKRGKKRSRSPPRADDPDRSPSSDVRVNGVMGDSDDDDSDGRDRTDDSFGHIDTPGIKFEGDNVIVGKGALLSSRNKKLHIQFDDSTTSTFEYPSESSLLADWSPSPSSDDSTEEQSIPGYNDPVCRESSNTATGTTIASSSGNLSSYTPSMLTSSKAFQLGVSRPIHREPSPVDTEVVEIRQKEESEDDVLKPADSTETTSWSSASTTDLLF